MNNLNKLTAQLNERRKKKPGARRPPSGEVSPTPEASFIAEGSDRTLPRSSPKRRNTGGERVVIYLPEEQARALRIHAAEQGCSLSHAVSEALSESGLGAS